MACEAAQRVDADVEAVLVPESAVVLQCTVGIPQVIVAVVRAEHHAVMVAE